MTGAIKEGFDNRLVAIKAGMEQIRQNYQRDGEFIRLTKLIFLIFNFFFSYLSSIELNWN